LKQRVTKLEAQIAAETEYPPFRPTGYYTAYYATTGFMLGIFGAMTSLLFNVVGSVLTGKHPLYLIQCYLTFPLGVPLPFRGRLLCLLRLVAHLAQRVLRHSIGSSSLP